MLLNQRPNPSQAIPNNPTKTAEVVSSLANTSLSQITTNPLLPSRDKIVNPNPPTMSPGTNPSSNQTEALKPNATYIGVGKKQTPPVLSIGSNFKKSCEQTPIQGSESSSKIIIPWDASKENYVYGEGEHLYQFENRLSKSALSTNVARLAGDPSWNPVKKYELCIILLIIWIVVVVVLVALLLLTSNNWMGTVGYEWAPIVAGVLLILFGVVLCFCCQEYANRLAWRKRLLLYEVLNHMEGDQLNGTALGMRAGPDGAWIEAGNKALLNNFNPSSYNWPVNQTKGPVIIQDSGKADLELKPDPSKNPPRRYQKEAELQPMSQPGRVDYNEKPGQNVDVYTRKFEKTPELDYGGDSRARPPVSSQPQQPVVVVNAVGSDNRYRDNTPSNSQYDLVQARPPVSSNIDYGRTYETPDHRQIYVPPQIPQNSAFFDPTVSIHRASRSPDFGTDF